MQQEIFYKKYTEELSKKLVDPRDNRGKRHNLVFICYCVIIAIMNGRLYPTAIQRYIKNRHRELCEITGDQSKSAISLSQLLRILRLIDWEMWNSVNLEHFGNCLELDFQQGEKQWQSIDGKELRGSIESGNTRGLNVVRSIGHEDKIVLTQAYYDGSKESEKLVVRKMAKNELKGEKITVDALHCEPELLNLVEFNKGKYIVQTKDNQKLLRAELIAMRKCLPVQGIYETHDKGHGRVESRIYESYDLRHPLFEDCLDERWKDAGIRTLIVCYRKFTTIKTDKVQEQTSWYLSNDVHLEEDNELLKTKQWGNAIRGHWGIESDHYVRDVTFKEDFLKIKDHQIQKIMSVCISAAVMLLRELNVTNFQAATEAFSDNPNCFFDQLKAIRFL